MAGSNDHEIVCQPPMPVVRTRGLHHGNPVPLLPVRFETYLGKKRERSSAEAAPALGEKDRLITQGATLP